MWHKEVGNRKIILKYYKLMICSRSLINQVIKQIRIKQLLLIHLKIKKMQTIQINLKMIQKNQIQTIQTKLKKMKKIQINHNPIQN